jgi:hypothetical protein
VSNLVTTHYNERHLRQYPSFKDQRFPTQHSNLSWSWPWLKRFVPRGLVSEAAVDCSYLLADSRTQSTPACYKVLLQEPLLRSNTSLSFTTTARPALHTSCGSSDHGMVSPGSCASLHHRFHTETPSRYSMAYSLLLDLQKRRQETLWVCYVGVGARSLHCVCNASKLSHVGFWNHRSVHAEGTFDLSVTMGTGNWTLKSLHTCSSMRNESSGKTSPRNKICPTEPRFPNYVGRAANSLLGEGCPFVAIAQPSVRKLVNEFVAKANWKARTASSLSCG